MLKKNFITNIFSEKEEATFPSERSPQQVTRMIRLNVRPSGFWHAQIQSELVKIINPNLGKNNPICSKYMAAQQEVLCKTTFFKGVVAF